MVQIASWAVGDPAGIEVRICDQSIGIPADQLEAILERFYRMLQVRLSWMTTPASEGIGLGLAICASMVRVHQGRIWAEGKSGEGPTYVSTLPIPAAQPKGKLPELNEAAPLRGASHEQLTNASTPAYGGRNEHR
jgi:two-component system sensor histidine kinase VicK